MPLRVIFQLFWINYDHPINHLLNIIMYHTRCTALVLPKQLLSYNPGRVITVAQVVKGLREGQHGILNSYKLIPADEMPGLMSF